jgi:heat shock protein HtpX
MLFWSRMADTKPAMKVWIYLSIMSLAIMYAGLKLGDRHGLLAGFLVSLALNALVYFFADLRLVTRFRSELLEGQDPWGMLSTVNLLSQKVRIPSPKLYLIDVATPITLSYGMSDGQYAISVSEGLVREFTKEEIEAVLALEIARLSRQDTALSTAAAALTAVFGTFARAIDNYLFLGILRSRRVPKAQPTMKLFFPIIALLGRLMIRRKDYFAADALASSLIQDPQRIASVLMKLHSFQNTMPFEIKASDVSLFVVSPLERYEWFRKFQPQPPVERRIKLLLGYYPI